jgi:hypothetical protein
MLLNVDPGLSLSLSPLSLSLSLSLSLFLFLSLSLFLFLSLFLPLLLPEIPYSFSSGLINTLHKKFFFAIQ